jgi:hypothetical protein
MAKNLGRKFATMSDDERRRFALEEEEGTRELPAELSFDEPRDEDKMGEQFSSIHEEVADPEHRDGMGALLDDARHQRAVEKAAKNNPEAKSDSE